MYKAYHIQLPVNLQKYFIINSGTRNVTRQQKNFFRKYVRTTQKQFCISNCGTKLWNNLEESIIDCKNICHFKKDLKKKIFSNYVS